MKAYDAQGNPVDVPEAEAQKRLQPGGDLYLPKGAPVPIRLPSGGIGTVPIEQLKPEDQIVSPEEHAKAVDNAHYESTLQGIRANAEAAISAPTFGATDVIAHAVGGPELAEEMRKRREHWPISTKVSGLAGMVGTSLLTGGASSLGEAGGLGLAEEAGGGLKALGGGAVTGDVADALRAAEAAKTATTAAPAVAEAPGLFRQGLNAFGAPMRGLGEVGDFAQGLATKLLPEEATTLGGRLLQAGVKNAAKFGAEAGLMSGGDYVSEQALDPNPDFSGEKLLMAMGHGALYGLAGGAVLGVGGELGSEVLGRLAPKIQGFAAEQAVKAAGPLKRGVRLILDIPGLPAEATAEEAASKMGGIRAMGDEVIKKVGLDVGDGPVQIADKAEAAARKVGAEVDGLRTSLDERGADGVLVKDVLDRWRDGPLKDLQALRYTNAGPIRRLNKLAQDLEFKAGVLPGMEDAERTAVLAKGRISYQDAAAFRQEISKQINDSAPALGQKPGILNTALKGMRGSFEDEIEASGDRAAKKLGDEDWLKNYQEAKLSYKKLALYNAIAQDQLVRKVANRNLSLTDYLTGGFSGAGLASGHPVAAAMGLASAVAHKVVRERGNATAAVLLDKIGALGAVRNAISKTERETARGIARAVGDEARVAPRIKTHLSTADYKAKAGAVMAAAQDPEGHSLDITAATAPFATHSPNVAKSFHVAALRATMYLASQLPKPKDETMEKMTPKLADYQPTSVAKAKFERQYNAVNDPVSILHGCSTGSVTLDEVDAVQNTHPEWLADTRKQLKEELLVMEKPLPFGRLIALSKFLGEPVHPLMRPEAIASIQNGHTNRPMPQTAPKPDSASKPTPHAEKLSFASASQLHIGGSQENA